MRVVLKLKCQMIPIDQATTNELVIFCNSFQDTVLVSLNEECNPVLKDP